MISTISVLLFEVESPPSISLTEFKLCSGSLSFQEEATNQRITQLSIPTTIMITISFLFIKGKKNNKIINQKLK